MRYFTTDHLGSVAVITDELGAVVERLSFDAWGKRRHADGTDDPSGTITSQTSRGFTGHEMIDEVGLVNMNGRVYDPEIGRFMSADPFVQDPTNTQSLNRYSYVGNNPLSYTDPSGYFLKKIWKALVAIVVAVIFMQPWMISAIGGALGLGSAGLAATVASAAIGGAIAGGIVGGGNLRSILTGAISGAAFAGLGGIDFTSAGLGAEVMAYGMTGGITSVIGGGEFQSGFLAAGFAALAGPGIQKFADKAGKGTASVVAGTAASAVAGGIGSVLGGGKFENGAVTGAFSYAVGRAIGSEQRSSRAANKQSNTEEETSLFFCKKCIVSPLSDKLVIAGTFGEVNWTGMPPLSELELILEKHGFGSVLGKSKFLPQYSNPQSLKQLASYAYYYGVETARGIPPGSNGYTLTAEYPVPVGVDAFLGTTNRYVVYTTPYTSYSAGGFTVNIRTVTNMFPRAEGQ
jgi:RHS repeat-associated protein